eukprot:CAMPEP_0169150012 /NCGR_PEP_ID=MMETSP1015-20121227/49901_1 /TAXON_ID=342587 /ORGANISM="Karlodinium micrum, Strain CCMP2283" /LENGTH=244 /DNA_ID=CAMNT_0009219007 /DNA_START=47 /DNA_END=781 /DNA_ORIENTATION=-
MALSSRRRESLRRKFVELDKNGDHKLSFDELKDSLQRKFMGKGIEELKASFKAADKNDDGFLNFHEYTDMENSKADAKCLPSCEDEQSTEAGSDGEADEKEARVHDGEDFNHWVARVDGIRRYSTVSSPGWSPAPSNGSVEEKVEKRRASLNCVLPPLSARRASDLRPTSRRSERRQSTGPARFFYDRGTYTGIQANRMPIPLGERQNGTASFRFRRRHTILGNTSPSTALNSALGNYERTVED